MSEIKYVVMEKQGMAVGVPFQVVSRDVKDVWITNFAYWQKQKREGGSQKPLFGRMIEKEGRNIFEVYIDGAWTEKDLWKDFSEEIVDEITKKKKKRLLFDNKKEYLLKFDSPVSIEYWNSDEGKKVVEQHTIAWVRFSKSLAEKLSEQFEDPRNNMSTFYQIDYDSKKSPSEQYKVKFVR